VHLWFRTLLVLWRARRRSKLAPTEVGRLALTVLPTDIDVLGHINNGVYLSLMDLGRYDWTVRTGMWDVFRAQGVYPVVVHQTISYRRSLDLWARYELQSRPLGATDRVIYFEQRFVRGGEVHARGVIGARFLRRTGGTLTTAELSELVGFDAASVVLPAWVPRWAEEVGLPSNREAHPSDWDI